MFLIIAWGVLAGWLLEPVISERGKDDGKAVYSTALTESEGMICEENER